MTGSQQFSDASSTTTRPKSGIITPASEGSPDANPATNPRKRKRESSLFEAPKKRKGEFSNSIEDLLKDDFIIRAHRSLVFSKPRTLQPILLLPRNELKLSYLDNGTTSSILSQSRFFESHIKILELEARLGSRPVVLIARLEDERSIYAVEREDRGLYVLCKLGSWVDLRALKAEAVVLRPDGPVKSSATGGGFAKGPIDTAVGTLITPEASKYNKKQKLAIEAIQTMVKRPQVQTPVSEPPRPEIPLFESASSATIASISQNPADELDAQKKDEPLPTSEVVEPTREELLDTIRAQYLEALYLSKASLAYFPKGPLSRARAAFHLDFDSTLDMKDLVEFLESMILTNSTMDKKFKDSVPELVKKMAMEFLSGDEAIKLTKKRKSKKTKRGKNGLYPCENALLRKWLSNNSSDDESGILNDSAIKGRVAELRIRETQLQMIILLEVLALKSLNSAAAGGGELPSNLPIGGLEAKKEKRGKSKKPEELKTLIDIHIDRLCIWQEVSSVGSTGLGQSQLDQGPSSGGLANISKHETNYLRDFCIEVIGPFFAARLPDLCTTINLKLGGPVAKPSPRPKLAKSASASAAISRPGTAARRPVLDKSRKSLQRVLTNERRARSVSRGTPDSAAISLMRSVSMSNPAIPRLKREASDATSLSGIPSLESQSSRNDVLNKKRYLQREVDLSVPPNAAADLKTKKQAAVEAELQDAIAALKKPNRQLAGRELVETAEHRTASASRSSRKTTKPIRNPLFKGIQIMATPKNRRHKDMMAAPKSIPPNNFTPIQSSQTVIPPSSIGHVPDSIVRPRSSRGAMNTTSAVPHAHPSRDNNHFNVAETPSRPPSRSHSWKNLSQAPDLPPSSPTYPRKSNTQQDDYQFAIPDSVIRNPFVGGNGNGRGVGLVESTPTKPRNGNRRSSFAPSALTSVSQRRASLVLEQTVSKFADIEAESSGKENLTPVKSTPNRRGLELTEDIYKTLGWDDDLDELA